MKKAENVQVRSCQVRGCDGPIHLLLQGSLCLADPYAVPAGHCPSNRTHKLIATLPFKEKSICTRFNDRPRSIFGMTHDENRHGCSGSTNLMDHIVTIFVRQMQVQ